MPIYEYKHVKGTCPIGEVFEVEQSIRDEPLTKCPNCGEPVRKVIPKTNISTAKTDSELRDLGFTKLVRRDDGVYENVTARNGESKVMHGNKPETYPNLKRTIRD